MDGSSTRPREETAVTALARLPERQRQVVALRIFLDLDTASTARLLGIAPACLFDPTGSPADYARIFPFIKRGASSTVAFDINPAALPAGAGLWIEVTPETKKTTGKVASYSFGMRALQIYASGRCPAPSRT